jgi:hypothetical protein
MFQFTGFAFDPYVFRTKYLLPSIRSQSHTSLPRHGD